MGRAQNFLTNLTTFLMIVLLVYMWTSFDTLGKAKIVLRRSRTGQALAQHLNRAQDNMARLSQHIGDQINSTETGRAALNQFSEHVRPVTDRITEGAYVFANDVKDRLNRSEMAHKVISDNVHELVETISDQVVEHVNVTELDNMREQFQDAATELGQTIQEKLNETGQALEESGVLDAVGNTTAALRDELERRGVFEAVENTTAAIRQQIRDGNLYGNAKRLASLASSYFSFAQENATVS